MEKFLKATHEGTLNIANKILPCAVLQDGTRILKSGSIFEAFERPKRGTRKADKMINLPNFIAAKNLLPYINSDINEVIKPIKYIGINNKIIEGYKAEILPSMCDLYLDARKDNTLTKSQERLAIISELMVRALSKVGIAALVDEATGYQDIRKKDALQALLDKYLLKEFAVWAKMFPDDFYKEIFRLRKWDWNDLTTKKPSCVGKFTNDLVYERLAPKILEELKARNPKNEKGYRKSKHHQWLTEDIGHPHLNMHIHAITGLMRGCTNWDTFYRILQRSFPKKDEQSFLNLEDE